jgi:hypothetical protein
LRGLSSAYRSAQVKAVHQEAHFFRKKVIECFKSGGKSNNDAWKSNSPSTIKGKGSSKPLIDKGDLIGSVGVVKAAVDTFFVGVPNNARSKSGTSYVKIGAVHEFGKVITMKITRKQWRWFMANAKKLGPGKGSGGAKPKFRPGAILTIKIPERSFLRSTRDAHFGGGKSLRRVKERMVTLLASKGVGT